jgi:hypothetical protein
LLVCCFVFFYCANNFLNFYTFYTPQKIPTLEVITGSLSASYPTLCPFVLLKNNKIFSKFIPSISMMKITCYQGALIGWPDTPHFLDNRRESLPMSRAKEKYVGLEDMSHWDML